MSDPESVKEFKDGLSLLRSEYAALALPHMRRALELDTKNPFYASYLGLTLAAAQGKWKEAEELCRAAVHMMRTQAEMYINLSEVYRLAGRNEDAVNTLVIGLQMTRQDPRVAKALRKLGVRRPPPIAFLDRNNFLNRQLGKLRHKVLKSFRAQSEVRGQRLEVGTQKATPRRGQCRAD